MLNKNANLEKMQNPGENTNLEKNHLNKAINNVDMAAAINKFLQNINERNKTPQAYL